MLTKEQEITRIHRSRIFELPFSREDVLTEEVDKTLRRVELERAMKLGNNYRQAVLLQFRTSDGRLGETEATIWAVTEKNVELKGGKIIPIAAIFNVDI